TGIQVDPKMAYSRATAINSRGITAGWTLSSEHIMHEGKRYALTQAFLYRPDIGAATLKVMGDGYHRIHVSGLNNEGVLAGYADNVSGERHAYRFQVVGGSTDLGSIGPLGEVKKINANGTVLAEWGNGPMKIQEYVPPFYALLILRSGQQVQLNKLGLGNTDAVDLNDSDIIVGRVTDEDGLTRAFFGDAEGHLNFLPVPKEYATFRSGACDLHNAGATLGAVENDPLLMTADDIPTYHALLQRWQPVIWGSVEKSAQVIRTDLRGMAVAMNETGSIVVLGFTKPESEETPSTLQVFILKPEASEPFKAAADK
ncbi:MAG: hypothetical protein KDK78_05580, partial [Chlamydiia bacterium]|nr:hypothetical protein [Chlamydiia bacterium]